MAGRIPAPAGLKLIKGRAPGRDSGGRKVEATPEFGRDAPTAPEWLEGEALDEWNRVVPDLERLQLLKTLDRAALAAYCLTWARFAEAVQVVRDEGSVLANDKTGRAQRHPALTTIEQASRELRAWSHEFGLTPSAEARLRTPKVHDGAAENPFATVA